MLFVLGGLVRATGSGMGCPDWPKCFGSYIPPVSEEQLPDDYQSFFLNQRLEKTERFVKLLEAIGMHDKAQEVKAYDQLAEAHEFNVAKAYTEYINRLWGAATGIVVLLCFIASFRLIKVDLWSFVFTTLGFIGVVVNALIGAVVVHANLIGNIVTIHFVAAFAALAFFLIARFRMLPAALDRDVHPGYKLLSLFILLLIFAQVIAGAQVRELYDQYIVGQELTLDASVELLGVDFVVHRIFALGTTLLFALQFYLFFKNFKDVEKLSKYALFILILSLVQITFGSMVITQHLEAISKLFHISIGAALFLIQFYICSLILRRPKTIESTDDIHTS